MGHALKNDNRSAKDSSYGTILETLQKLARDDILPQNKDIQLLGSQKALKNPDTMCTKNLIEIDILPSNKRFSEKEKITAEIEQLKKKQNKTLMKFKLYCLKKFMTQKFVKNISK